MSTSCVGCKFLYGQGCGYSNYTWESTEIRCALEKNPALPADEPHFDWSKSADADNWRATKDGRCDSFSPGEYLCLDVDGDDGPADFVQDEEQISAICKDSGRGRNGYGAKS